MWSKFHGMAISENREIPKRSHANETFLQQFPPSLFSNINAQCGVRHSHNFKIRRSKNHENKKAVASEYSSPLSLPSPPSVDPSRLLDGQIEERAVMETSLSANEFICKRSRGDGHPSLNETRSRLRSEMFLGRRSPPLRIAFANRAVAGFNEAAKPSSVSLTA